MKRIIDVSTYNGKVDWAAVKKDGICGAIIKIISKQLVKDKQFDTNVKGVTAQKIPWEVYNYTYATTASKARSDMALICDILDKSDRTYFKGHIWFDLEDACQTKLSKATVASIINAAQEVVESRGYKFGVYSGDYYLKSYVDLSKVKNKDWWLARYYLGYKAMYANTAVNESYKPSAVSPLIGWQYTSSYYIGGKKFDASELYYDLGTTLNSTGSTVSANTGTVAAAPAYKVGNTYTTQVELRVRTGAGVTYSAKTYSQLTTDGKKHDTDKDGAIDKGTKVTCKEIKKVGADIWMRTPSGWMAAFYKGMIYIK